MDASWHQMLILYPSYGCSITVTIANRQSERGEAGVDARLTSKWCLRFRVVWMTPYVDDC